MNEERNTGSFEREELKFLARNRERMSNSELRDFFEGESDFHEDARASDSLEFSRWEERFILQNYRDLEIGGLADELGRKEEDVRVKLRSLDLLER